MTPSDIIARLGGAAALASALGFPRNDVGAKRIRAWDRRKRIPPEYWAAVIASSANSERGVSGDDLIAAHSSTEKDA